jgi:type I restriction enzyme S subunit
MSYQVHNIGELTHILSGFAFDACHFDKAEGIKLIRIRDVKRGYSETEYSGEYDQKYIVRRGDILIGMDGEFNVARWRSDDALLNQRVCKIEVSNKQLLDPNYLYYFLPAQLKKIEDATPFVTVKHLSVKSINQIKIPLPPIAEQQRIAAILDKAGEIKAKREQAIANLDVLEKSQFNCLLNAASPSTYKSIADLVTDVKSISPSQVYGEEQFMYIDIGAVDNKSKMIVGAGLVKGTAAASRARQQCQKGDVLVSTVRPNLNAVALLGQDFLRPIASTGFCVLRADTRKLLPEVLFGFVKSKLFIAEMERLATGASYPAVTDKIIKAYTVPELSMNDQVRYAAFYQFSQRLRRQFDDHLLGVEQLISSLKQKSFSGELK